MRHTGADLAQMQALPLEAKVAMTKNRIRQWYEHWDGEVYVAFSGGKDSAVLKHIVDSMYDDVPSVFVNTGLEFPEVRQYAMKQKNVVRRDPKMKFYEVINKYGFPIVSKEVADCVYGARKNLREDPNANTVRVQRIRGTLKDKNGKKSKFCCDKWKCLLDAPFEVSGRCCECMKKSPLHAYEKETGRKPIVGVMAHESRIRKLQWLKQGCNVFDGDHAMSKPLSFWTEQDILQYIVDEYMEIASVYGDIIKDVSGHYRLTGEQRTGCMFCMFGVHLEDSPNRFQRMAISHPKQYEYCMNKLGLKQVLDYMHIKYKPEGAENA